MKKWIKKVWNKTWNWIKPYLTPKMLPFILISWCITNGWAYIFAILGPILNITWMTTAGVTWATILWMPMTPEKPLVTIPLALLMYRLKYKEKFIKKSEVLQ